ncbi:MAG TPA: chorismate mutase [Longimicrobiales bacterium]
MTDTEHLEELRSEIVAVDGQLVALLARRLALVEEVGRVKRRLGLPTLDPTREAEVVRRAAQLAREHGVDPELARDVIWRVMAYARDVQDTREE